MSFNYASIANTTLEQISDKGRSVTLKRKSNKTYDSSTNTMTGSDPADETIKVLSTEYKASEIDGTLIKAGDKKFLLAAKGIVKPKQNDVIVDDETYRIMHVGTVAPGDTAILYKLQVRR